MQIRYPAYYRQFTCLAGACPDSCCHEWEVDVDPQAAAFYRQLEGPLGDDLRRVLRDGDDGWASMTITADRRCPMWRRDGLCRIQAALGHDALCATCREFPRLRHDYGDFVELGLELSCPEAARLILSAPPQAMVTEVHPGGPEPDYDTRKMELLLASRSQALEILSDPSLAPNHALAVLLLYGYAVQEALDWDETVDFSRETAVTEAAALAREGRLADILALYGELEILTDRWRRLLDSDPHPAAWTESHRFLARYFVERYWLQAISDGDLVCRVKFLIASCLVIRGLGGRLEETAQLYSKEIENDADNVDALLDAAYTSPALADVKLLGLLLR